jgi:hypothetical protein
MHLSSYTRMPNQKWELKPEEIHVFYAHDQANLPLLGHNSTDVLKLLEQIQNMKNDIRLLTEAQTSSTELDKQQAPTLSNATTLGASSTPTAQRVEKTQKPIFKHTFGTKHLLHSSDANTMAADVAGGFY